MNSFFEKQTVKKIKTVLRLLEGTLNNEENVEVRITNLKSLNINITNEREKVLELGIENSIIGLKELINQIDERNNQKEQIAVFTTVSMNSKNPQKKGQ